MPNLTLTAFFRGVVRGAVVALALGFLIYYVRRAVISAPAPNPVGLSPANSSKDGLPEESTVDRRPANGIPAGLASPTLTLGMSRELAEWLAQRSVESDPRATRDPAARLIEPLWSSYLGSRKANLESRQVDLWQQLFELGIVINEDNYAFLNSARNIPAKATAVVDAWNALTTASENARSMAGSTLANRADQMPPTRIVIEIPQGMVLQTNLPVSSAALSDWLKPTEAGEALPVSLVKERATLLVSWLARPYERGQDAGVRLRLKNLGIVVDDNHRAHLDPAVVEPAKVDPVKAQAVVEAWNVRSPKPTAIDPGVPLPPPQAQVSSRSFPDGMSLQALTSSESRAQPSRAVVLAGSKSAPVILLPSLQAQASSLSSSDRISLHAFPNDESRTQPSRPVVLGGSKSMPMHLFDGKVPAAALEERRKAGIAALAPFVKSQDAGTRQRLEEMGIVIDAANRARIDLAKVGPARVNLAVAHAAVEAWNAFNSHPPP